MKTFTPFPIAPKWALFSIDHNLMLLRVCDQQEDPHWHLVASNIPNKSAFQRALFANNVRLSQEAKMMLNGLPEQFDDFVKPLQPSPANDNFNVEPTKADSD